MIQIFGNSIWQLVYNSDFMTWMILILLLVLSIICWSIFFYKLIIWRIKRRQILNAINSINIININNNKFDDISRLNLRFVDTLPGEFFSKSIILLQALLRTGSELKTTINSNNFNNSNNNDSNLKINDKINDREWEFLHYSIHNISENCILQEHSLLPFLAVTASVSPLLGLFGTVWGLVHAFVDISQKQSADIATVAPGIAEALITTLAGLMVAIPALALYYYLRLRVSKLEQLLNNVTDSFILALHKLFNKS